MSSKLCPNQPSNLEPMRYDIIVHQGDFWSAINDVTNSPQNVPSLVLKDITILNDSSLRRSSCPVDLVGWWPSM